MKKLPTKPNYKTGIERAVLKFENCIKYPDLVELLGIELSKLQLLSIDPPYKRWHIRKKSGGLREIEDPQYPLKSVLRILNHYLQCVYYGWRPDSVFGFCYSTRNELERNVISNASRHIGNAYMVNIDLLSFFHAISASRVHDIYRKLLPNAEEEVIRLISTLSVLKSRLPMGAPTSPALSNFACLEMDAELMSWSEAANVTYTRYADDLSFSSHFELNEKDLAYIRSVIIHHSFTVNEKKVFHYKPSNIKIVTGLVVGAEEVELPQNYLNDLQGEIKRLAAAKLIDMRYDSGHKNIKLQRFEQEIRGKLNFAGMVDRQNATKMNLLYHDFESAIAPDLKDQAISWLDVPYEFLP